MIINRLRDLFNRRLKFPFVPIYSTVTKVNKFLNSSERLFTNVPEYCKVVTIHSNATSVLTFNGTFKAVEDVVLQGNHVLLPNPCTISFYVSDMHSIEVYAYGTGNVFLEFEY